MQLKLKYDNKVCSSLFCICIFFVFFLLLLSGCNKSFDGVAAYVNDTSISEDDVTNYVHEQRIKLNLSEDDQSWKNFLTNNKMTPKTYRDKAVDQLIDKEVIRQYCLNNDISISQEDIDYEVAVQSGTYSSWDQYIQSLSNEGKSLEQQRQIIKDQLLEDKATKKLIDDFPTPQDSITKLLFAYSSKLNGSKGYYQIILPIEKKSIIDDIYNDISSGSISFEDACSQISKNDNTGINFDYVIYQCFIQNPQVCTDVLNSLSVGQMSYPVVADNYVYLFKVVDEIHCDDNIISLSQLSEYTKNNLEYYAKVIDKSSVIESAFKELKNSFFIKKFSAPNNLDYF